MIASIAEYWEQLDGSVHPEDKRVFGMHEGHGFNLSYPPPAFIGDIVNAPVVILQNNGGYNADTPNEFPDAESHAAFRDMLANPRPLDPNARCVSPYYLNRNYTPWLVSGQAALVNGVAYRSPNGHAAGVARLTDELPSAQFHRRWLQEVLFPLTDKGERFVVVHRWGRWNHATDIFREHPNAVFSSAPASANLTSAELERAQAFLSCG